MLHNSKKRGKLATRIVTFFCMLVIVGFALSGYNVTNKAFAQTTPAQKDKASAKKTLNFLTTAVGTGCYSVSAGLGILLNKKLPNQRVFVQPASSALAVPRLMDKGDADLLILPAPTPYWAYKGEEDYSTTPPISSIRVLQSGNDMYFALVTRSDSGINAIGDLKGKKVAFDIRGSRTLTKVASLMLQAYGLDPKKDVIPVKAEFDTVGLTYVLEKRADAAIVSLTGSKIVDAERKIELKILPIEADKIAFLRKSLPVVLPAKTPTDLIGIKPNIPVSAIPLVLGANQNMDNETAYNIVKTILENYKELIPTHRDFASWSPERAVRNLGMPYHPGAVKYYREKGLWTAEMEQMQRTILGK